MGIALGDHSSRRALGQLLHDPGIDPVLPLSLRSWYEEFALHFRNLLAHPKRSVAMTPGMAEPFVRTTHDVVAELFPDV